MSKSQILNDEIEKIKQDLIEKHIELKMKASGDWINGLNVQSNGLTATLYGKPYTEQLVNGRPNGKFPPISAIRQWIVDKNITPFDKISISSLAFFIARKIAREGTKSFKKGGTDLVSSVITPDRVQDIINKVSDFEIRSLVSDVSGVLNQLKKI